MADEQAPNAGWIASLTEADWRALGAIYILLVAALLSSSWVVTSTGYDSRVEQLAVAAVLAVFWTLYYAVSMHDRILAYATDEEEAG